MLAQIGAVTLPQETAERLYAGESLSADEQEMVDRIPALSHSLLVKIPRLEGVLAILDAYSESQEAGDSDGVDASPPGARVLRIVTDYDELESKGLAPSVALGTMNGRPIYDARLLEAFARSMGHADAVPVVVEVPVSGLKVGMTLADDLRSKTGSLLMARGQAVTAPMIERLKNMGEDSIDEPARAFEP